MNTSSNWRWLLWQRREQVLPCNNNCNGLGRRWQRNRRNAIGVSFPKPFRSHFNSDLFFRTFDTAISEEENLALSFNPMWQQQLVTDNFNFYSLVYRATVDSKFPFLLSCCTLLLQHTTFTQFPSPTRCVYQKPVRNESLRDCLPNMMNIGKCFICKSATNESSFEALTEARWINLSKCSSVARR